MTLDQDAAIIPTTEHERPADPRPAWERIAHAWLEREVDAGQPVDPATLAGEVSVAPGLARDLLRVLRGHRDRDPGLSELRGRVVRDRIIDAYLRRELGAGGRLDPAELAAEVGTSPAVARQWLAGLRAQHPSGHDLQVLTEPVSHGHPTPAQLAGLQAHFAAGGHQHAAVTGRPVDPERLAAEVERRYWTREIRAGQRLRPGQLARELGGDQRQIRQQLAELRAGPSTAPSASPSSGTPSSRIRRPGRSAPASSPGGWGSPTATSATSPGSSAPATGSRRWPSGSRPPTSSSPAHHHRSST
jgi:hypothetical protein